MEGGLAAADVLCGDVTPSGKLVDTFAKKLADYPSSPNFHDSILQAFLLFLVLHGSVPILTGEAADRNDYRMSRRYCLCPQERRLRCLAKDVWIM